ncbi:type IV toxin-antitoxin system AbiEi family antitoxin [Brevibacterium aurantiacum]|uniref:Uncharacterized protein n=1 Tax=Brevibacterium aurantiacum TaxID=273384 RepID=A0A4Z0KHR3_BREAU|nr:type IV toxin-antitoxin system AbiEi family antitoxin [Brevibacterium aurantiacum]TGD38306.1 hypothetical protein EB834_12535 [Brevibacterium aurantiacum]
MPVDVAALLQELDVLVTAGPSRSSWLLRTPDGAAFELEPTTPAEHLNAAQVRIDASRRIDGHSPLLHVGRIATAGVVGRAEAGEIDILTAKPIRLIHAGRIYEAAPAPSPRQPPRHTGKPAWVRWALQRYLLLTPTPSRQPVIAESLGTSQQSVSRSAQSMQSLVIDMGDGLFAPDRAQLLDRWRNEYPGPGGQEFGWYGLDAATKHVEAVVGLATQLEIHTLVSGDVAADKIAPWKLPMQGRVYVTEPIDLADEGFVPVPLDEANLVTCVPRDPTLWRLAPSQENYSESDDLPIADAAIVYWDLLMGGDQDSEEAAQQVSRLLTGDQR